jgi:hypothetical protein
MNSATSSTRSTTSPGGTRTGPKSASSTRSCWPTTGAACWMASRGCPWVINLLRRAFLRRRSCGVVYVLGSPKTAFLRRYHEVDIGALGEGLAGMG